MEEPKYSVEYAEALEHAPTLIEPDEDCTGACFISSLIWFAFGSNDFESVCIVLLLNVFKHAVFVHFFPCRIMSNLHVSVLVCA